MSAGARTRPSVSIVTSHGRQQLDWRDGERLFELLQRSGVPWSAVSIYVRRTDGGEAVLTPCLDAIVGELDAAEVLLYFNRNVNPFLFALGRFKVVDSDDASGGASE